MNTPIKTTICALAAITCTHAQDTTIDSAEATFRRLSAEAIAPVTDRYITTLSTLARKLDNAGKTADSQAVTAELERIRSATDAGEHPLDTLPNRSSTHLENTGSPEFTGTISTGAIFLSPDQATLSGSIEPHHRTRVLRKFLRKEDTATWPLDKFAPGTYDLILEYSCPKKGAKNAGGGTLSLTAGDTKSTISIEPKGTQSDFRKKMIGRITLTGAPLEISLAAAKAETRFGVLRLRALILNPR